MGGSGSGRIGWRRRVGSYLRLDIRQLARKGLLRPWYSGGWGWQNSDGEQTATIAAYGRGASRRDSRHGSTRLEPSPGKGADRREDRRG
jgi:hypothetical protein